MPKSSPKVLKTKAAYNKMQDKTGPQNRGKTRVVSQKENRGWRKDNPEAYTKRKT